MVMHALPRNFRLSVEFESCALLHAAGRLGRPPPSLLGRRDVGCAHDLRLKCPQSDRRPHRAQASHGRQVGGRQRTTSRDTAGAGIVMETIASQGRAPERERRYLDAAPRVAMAEASGEESER